MNIKTFNRFDEVIWNDAGPLYFQAFGDKGAKPVKVIKHMLDQGIADLHVCYKGNTAVGMALTGKLSTNRVMIIDYLAVSKDERGQGLGQQLVKDIQKKALAEGYRNLLIETEAEDTPDNKGRVQFWQSCGFLLTDYVHQYIWVPEAYQAMYFPLTSQLREITGEELFGYLNTFHRLSFKGSSNQ